MDVTKAVQESKAGKIEYRLDKTNIIHCPDRQGSFGAEKLQDNFDALMGAIIKAKPAAAKVSTFVPALLLLHGPRHQGKHRKDDRLIQ